MAMFAPDVTAVAHALAAKLFYRDSACGIAKPPLAVVDAYQQAAKFLNEQ
jgi:hypothetical protein